MGISEDANAAADYIETHGWHQGHFTRPNGNVCLIGGLAQGSIYRTDIYCLTSEDGSRYLNPTSNAITDYLGIKAGHIAEWNDTEGRTQNEVVQVLRDVATKHMPDSMRSNTDER